MAQAGRQQFKKKLAEILEHPRIEANRLHSLPDCYKIKLSRIGYRLVYQALDHEVAVFVVAVDKCEREQAYRKAAEHLIRNHPKRIQNIFIESSMKQLNESIHFSLRLKTQ